ncbi:MAG: diguanylate cyclase [Bacilli bacterium]|nr:diguanylate cyclase [Bacilli bacterium]
MKRRNSLSLKLTLVPVITVLLAFGGSAAVTFSLYNESLRTNAKNSIALTTERATKQIDDAFVTVESSVKTVEYLATKMFNDLSIFDDIHSPGNEYSAALDELKDLFALSAEKTQYVCGYWMICSPEVTHMSVDDPHGQGFFVVKETLTDTFVEKNVTNVLKYADDPYNGNVIWWTAPTQAMAPSWVEPYYNDPAAQNLVSYAIPVRIEDTFIGIVGVDLRWDEIVPDIRAANKYATGKPFLLNGNGRCLSHPDIQTMDENGHYVPSDYNFADVLGQSVLASQTGAVSYNYQGQERFAATTTLTNGMVFGLSVSSAELFHELAYLTIIPASIYAALTVALSLFLFFYSRHLLRPLGRLKEAAEQVESGDLDVSLPKGGNDEIGVLTDSFDSMLASLRSNQAAMNALAFQDGLTGVKNKNAQEEKIEEINTQIKLGIARFAVIMCDVDDLKTINDEKGHGAGDEAIRTACLALCKAFAHSPVYRVGGDEFVAIAEGEDYDRREELFAEASRLSGIGNGYHFSMGMATYQQGIDMTFAAVSSRADNQMYAVKKRRKSGTDN